MRALSWALIAASFLAGLFLPDWVAKAAVPEPKPASVVSLQDPPGEGTLDSPRPLAATGAPGAALTPTADGKAVAHEPDVITPLNVRDPSALVMGPGSCPAVAAEPCACDEDSLHRYAPKKTRKKDLESLKTPGQAPRPSTDDKLVPDSPAPER